MAKPYEIVPIGNTASQRSSPLFEPYKASEILNREGKGICGLKFILSSFLRTLVQIIKCYMIFKKDYLISQRHLFSWKMLASSIEDLSFALSPPLCSNFQELPRINGFLQMRFAVTSGVIVKHMHIYFIRNMYHLIT